MRVLASEGWSPLWWFVWSCWGLILNAKDIDNSHTIDLGVSIWEGLGHRGDEYNA